VPSLVKHVSRAPASLGIASALLILGLFLHSQQAGGQGVATGVETPDTIAFVCPMHPDYTNDVEGSCPRCGMALVKGAPFDVRDYQIDFRTVPAVVKPGQKAELRFRMLRPGTGELVKTFEVVHEKQFHLFVISQDMTYFQHIHPVLHEDGTWTIDITLPRAGYYKVLADFLPSGGSWQFMARPLVTAGFEGDLAGDSAVLMPDTSPTSTVDGLTATVSFDPPTLVAGLYGHISYRLTDASGRLVTDLQTYLGAFGHTLIMSEDMTEYVHSHPLDILPGRDDDVQPQFVIPPGADLEKLRGGPDVTFDGLIPRPGRYRAWTQFRWHDKVYTFASTFNAVAP
jgi:Heavy metal binding domain